jgi:hypothetical protein
MIGGQVSSIQISRGADDDFQLGKAPPAPADHEAATAIT